MNNKYFLLFEDCRIVKGYLKAIIYDLNRPTNSNEIPISLIEFIESCIHTPVNDVINSYKDVSDQNIALEYIDFLIEREYGFFADDHVKKHIKKLSLVHESPSYIKNAIICYNNNIYNSLTSIISELNLLMCEDVEFRCDIKSKVKLNDLLNTLIDSIFKRVIIRLNYMECLTEVFLNKYTKKNPRIAHTYIYNAPFDKQTDNYTFSMSSVDYYNDCGIINKDNFIINQPFFIESQSFNTCLHKKVSIDFKGDIKHCPSMNKSYGNINDKSLIEIINQSNFQEKWQIKKDNILICNDCEHRHMCMDCRAFIQNSSNKNSKPSKCSYNPYIGKWDGENGYLTIEDCGIELNGNEIKIDHDKLRIINKRLWAD